MNHRIISILKGIVVIAGVGSLVLVTILLFPASAPAVPTIAWTPATVTSEVAREYSKTVPVSFISSEDVTNVQVRVVPELQPFVQVRPAAFAVINKGQTASVTVIFSASKTAPFGTVKGTIQLRVGNTLAKPLPVSLLVTVVPLPPDPGPAGKATLQGIDSDGDGLRDDVQRSIALTFPESARTRAAMTQYAVAFLLSLLLGNGDAGALRENAAEVSRSIECIAHVLGADRMSAETQRLDSLLRNTRPRIDAYITTNARLSGQSFSATPRSRWKSSCSFDVDSMEN